MHRRFFFVKKKNRRSGSLEDLFGGRNDIDKSSFLDFAGESFGAFFNEIQLAIGCGEQSIINTLHDIFAGKEFGASLSDKNVSGFDDLTGESFDAKSLGDGIAAVRGTTTSFFV